MDLCLEKDVLQVALSQRIFQSMYITEIQSRKSLRFSASYAGFSIQQPWQCTATFE